jgi:hypothetical protein
MIKIIYSTELTLEEKMTVIKEELAKLEKELAEKPKPKKWIVCGDGLIVDSEVLSDINLYNKMGLAFHTKQEALEKVEEMKLLKEVKDYIDKANKGKEPYDGATPHYVATPHCTVFPFNSKKFIVMWSSSKHAYRFFSKDHAEEFGNLFYDRLLKFNLI